MMLGLGSKWNWHCMMMSKSTTKQSKPRLRSVVRGFSKKLWRLSQRSLPNSEVTWGRYALADREAIFDYLEPLNPVAAVNMDLAVEASVQILASYPNIGREGRVPGTREWPVVGTPYIVAYAVLPDRVKILRVLHGAQKWPTSIAI
jgi:addiction module RelE/StbE family toxin